MCSDSQFRVTRLLSNQVPTPTLRNALQALPPSLSISYLRSRKTKAPRRNAVFRVARNNSEPHTQLSSPSSKLSVLTSRRRPQAGWTPLLQRRSEVRNTAAAILNYPCSFLRGQLAWPRPFLLPWTERAPSRSLKGRN